jgi:hypothetical protein
MRLTKEYFEARFAEEERMLKEYNEWGYWSEKYGLAHSTPPPLLDREAVRKYLRPWNERFVAALRCEELEEENGGPLSNWQIFMHWLGGILGILGVSIGLLLGLCLLFWLLATGTAIIILGLGAIGAWVVGLSK